MSERNEAEREREREEGEFADITIWPARNPLLAKLWSYRAATCQLQATPSENVGRVLSGSRCSSRAPVSRRSLSSRGESYNKVGWLHESGRCDVRVEEYKGVASNGLVAAFEGKISVRDGISREDRHSFVRETVTERNATPRNELFFDNFGILYTRLETCVSKCNTCSRDWSNAFQASILDQWTVRARFFPRFDTGRGEEERREKWVPLGEAIPLRSQRVTPTHRSRITRDEWGKWISFWGAKEIFFEEFRLDDDRRQFSILTANSVSSRAASCLLDSRAKIRACLFVSELPSWPGRTERDGRRDRHRWI